MESIGTIIILVIGLLILGFICMLLLGCLYSIINILHFLYLVFIYPIYLIMRKIFNSISIAYDKFCKIVDRHYAYRNGPAPVLNEEDIII